MKYNKKKLKAGFFEQFAGFVSRATGTTTAFIIALALVLIWGVSGPIFHYSEKWQLVINTGTTIITFLMVFLIQKSQNKDSLAIQLKLNELVAAHESASNRLVNAENMTEEEMRIIQKYYGRLKDSANKEKGASQSHSIDETGIEQEIKKEMEKELKKKTK